MIYLVGVYVKTAAAENVAKSKIITAHCWVITKVERLYIGCAKMIADKQPGPLVIEYKSREALVPKRFPACEAFLDIVGYIFEIVPVLD
ncbi:MAG: hypothetical protein Q8N09_09910 [Thermodesulfovibrionia bacterium]|nr:hypothetical protein [Thermodesulfovibrionia bacterium]